MASRVETNPLEAAYAALLSHGLDGAGEALRILVDKASKIERSHHLQAAPHERSEDRTLWWLFDFYTASEVDWFPWTRLGEFQG